MIPYEQLVDALIQWRARNGLQTGAADYLGDPLPPAAVDFGSYGEAHPGEAEVAYDAGELDAGDMVVEEAADDMVVGEAADDLVGEAVADDPYAADADPAAVAYDAEAEYAAPGIEAVPDDAAPEAVAADYPEMTYDGSQDGADPAMQVAADAEPAAAEADAAISEDFPPMEVEEPSSHDGAIDMSVDDAAVIADYPAFDDEPDPGQILPDQAETVDQSYEASQAEVLVSADMVAESSEAPAEAPTVDEDAPSAPPPPPGSSEPPLATADTNEESAEIGLDIDFEASGETAIPTDEPK